VGLFALPLLVGAEGEVTNFDIKKGIVGNLGEQCREYGNCTWCDFIGLFIILQKVILSLFGGLALVMIIWGGQGMMMSAGNQEKFTEGKKLVTSTLFGVFIILAGYLLINILVAILSNPASGNLSDDKKPKPSLLTTSWWQAKCITPTTCNSTNEGKSCDLPDKTKGVCFQNSCVTKCAQKYGGAGYACKNVTNCSKVNTLATCTGEVASCYTGLCPGETEIVCCQ
jgi:hypothetical protein